MKKLMIALLFVTAATFTQAQKAEKQTLTVKTNIYCDHCLQCGSCSGNINSHIRENKGIKQVKIDAKANTITVVYDAAKTTPESIRIAINAAGYDADDKKAPADAVNKLDGCCKK
jgi:mercuric ion binding protein